MKIKNFIIIISLGLCFSCNKDDNTDNSGYPSITLAYFEFLKSDGSSFLENEIEYKQDMLNAEGDTIYGSWLSLPIIQNEGLPYANHFGPLEIAIYDDEFFENEDEWNSITFYKFKYLNSEIIDNFIVKDSGKYKEYRYIKVYLNDENIEPELILDNSTDYFFKIIKEDF